MTPVRIGMVSLGCPKNLVDSELILGLLKTKSYRLAQDVSDCDVALINTCAFIGDARKESVDSILELARLKKEGKIRKLIVCGCLPQKYYGALAEEISEIDALVGTGEYAKIDAVIESVMAGEKPVRVEDTRFVYDHSMPRFSLTPRHFKYVKVGEGCDHRCTFCIIPELRGDYRSRPLESIVKEVREAAREGLQEVNLISQDTSYYGRDLGGRYLLPELLRALNEIDGLQWIRLLYNHPIHLTDEILAAMRDCAKVVKYVDIPLQHASSAMLKAMKRGMTKEQTAALLERMRETVPGLAIRTTFIVGFPGETETDFEELYDFVQAHRFDRLGVFTYSRGDDKAAVLEHQVPEKIKKERKDRLMKLQQGISLEMNRRFVGTRLDVLIEEFMETRNEYAGRSYRDAPEIDGQVRVVSRRPLEIGRIYPVEITQNMEYDLDGKID
ncbi:MAG: 30S ribosomal protein S12 methylthiotransferase RimO [Candidatus Omnitrophica bacterium]|nr:30S ribosomal protein S12 methylthiotransferase RimO [Candidatus Omnitrophota bacterium]